MCLLDTGTLQGDGLLGYDVFIALFILSSCWQESVSDACLLHFIAKYQVLQPFTTAVVGIACAFEVLQ
jgi:hypothetical protein